MIIIDSFIEIYTDHVRIREATKQGYSIAYDGDSINFEQPNSKTRRGRVGHQICQTLTCSCNQGVIIDMNESKPKLVGGIGEINFGKQYRQGNRIYDAKEVAMCLNASPLGNTGGYSYLYKVDNSSNDEINIKLEGNNFNQRKVINLGDGICRTITGQGHCGNEPKTLINNLNNKRGNSMKEFKNETLEKLNFNMDEIRLFDSFAGIGSLHNSLKFLGIPTKIIGLSETDIDAIISYASIHIENFKDLEFDFPSEENMRKWLINRNIGWSFEKQKSSIPRLKKDKLYKLYKACSLLNNLGDISKITYENMPDFDLFNMSFPCTDISGAGKQKGLKNEDGTHTRSGLVKYGIELIKAKKPKYVMIENVKALIQKKFINDFYSICNEIKSYGYKIYYPTKEDNKGNKQPMCLNAKNYGIPQNRERIFVICVRNDCNDKIDNFWEGQDFGYRLKDFLEDTVDEKYYINKEWHVTTPEEQKHDNNEIAQINNIEYKATRSVGDPNKICRTLDTMGGGQREPKTIESTSFIDKQNRIQEFKRTENYIQWDSNGKNYNGQIDRACYENKNINTIPAMNPQDKCKITQGLDTNNFRIRKLTPKECWRLMGFTDNDFDNAKSMGISDSALYKQAGNSIVVNCLYYIFKELFKNYIIEE